MMDGIALAFGGLLVPYVLFFGALLLLLLIRPVK
jgi:hypothetical protein